MPVATAPVPTRTSSASIAEAMAKLRARDAEIVAEIAAAAAYRQTPEAERAAALADAVLAGGVLDAAEAPSESRLAKLSQERRGIAQAMADLNRRHNVALEQESIERAVPLVDEFERVHVPAIAKALTTLEALLESADELADRIDGHVPLSSGLGVEVPFDASVISAVRFWRGVLYSRDREMPPPRTRLDVWRQQRADEAAAKSGRG